ncbi:MAG: hypothetical protein AAGG68_04400 [Bacteroidota bacterium]
MKQSFILLLSIFLLAFSCEEDAPTPEKINKWKLIEQLSDPGDGSGTFQVVDSERTIEFVDEEIVRSNGSFCNMGTGTEETVTATHNPEEKFILVEACGGTPFKILYDFDEEFLYLRFPCREPCAQKYERVQ